MGHAHVLIIRKLSLEPTDICSGDQSSFNFWATTHPLRMRDIGPVRHGAQSRDSLRESGIRGRHKRRWKATTDSKHDLPVAANLVSRDFSPREPNQTWGADITYIATDEGWLYLAIVLDFFNREIVGWALKDRLTADLAMRSPWPGFGAGPRRIE